MGCAQAYVHRVGRTGRAGQAGTAVTLFTPQDAELEAELTQQLGGARQPSAPAAAAEEGEAFDMIFGVCMILTVAGRSDGEVFNNMTTCKRADHHCHDRRGLNYLAQDMPGWADRHRVLHVQLPKLELAV